jgi:pimeloyl-ACP methyl ester carboxylesterase
VADFLEFFFSQCFTEPHSRDYIDHFITMGLQTTPEIVTMTEDEDDLDEQLARELLGQVRCPAMVIHGRDDAIAPVAWGVEAARLLGAELDLIPGAGHEPELRASLHVNRLIDSFLATLSWAPAEHH